MYRFCSFITLQSNDQSRRLQLSSIADVYSRHHLSIQSKSDWEWHAMMLNKCCIVHTRALACLPSSIVDEKDSQAYKLYEQMSLLCICNSSLKAFTADARHKLTGPACTVVSCFFKAAAASVGCETQSDSGDLRLSQLTKRTADCPSKEVNALAANGNQG